MPANKWEQRILVLEGWREEAAFDDYDDARLFVAFMEEKHPDRKFDIWLDKGAGQRKVLLREGQRTIDDMAFIGHGFGRFARQRHEIRIRQVADAPRIRILRTILASEEYPGID